MTLWVIADLHLAFSTPSKKMDVFGNKWVGYAAAIEKHWKKRVEKNDLVLLPGDISWAMRLPQALIDLKWIDALPGTKLMIRGNHDYWWSSAAKLRAALPPTIHILANDAFRFEDVAIAGSRLWDSKEYSFETLINFTPQAGKEYITPTYTQEDAKIFERELNRLEMSLKAMDQSASCKIAMTHYPPISHDLRPSRAAQLFEEYGVHHVVFGHLHNVKEGVDIFGERRGVHYHLTSADYLNFIPLQLKP